jgi:hypothetical protein
MMRQTQKTFGSLCVLAVVLAAPQPKVKDLASKSERLVRARALFAVPPIWALDYR